MPELNVSQWERALAFVAGKWHASVQLLRYFISGVAANVSELALLYVFTRYLGIWYLFSLVLAFAIAFWISFFLQKFWTFQDKHTHRVHMQASSYLLVQLVNLSVNAAALYVLVHFFGLWYMLAQVMIIAVIAISNFFIYKFIIFKKHESIIV
jgi:putative flippase GtrA